MHFLRLEADLLSRLQRKQELSPHGWLLTPVRNANRFEHFVELWTYIVGPNQSITSTVNNGPASFSEKIHSAAMRQSPDTPTFEV